MALNATNLMTFAEFLDWNPENGRYELIEGVAVEMQPTGKHEQVIAFLSGEIFLQIRGLKLPYFISSSTLVKLPNQDNAYRPDILVLDRNFLSTEPLWEKSSTITKGSSVRLVVEVVSTNWRDDYVYKMTDYETLGITEYWIIDYLGLGGKRYIGFPKEPTITICQLIDGEYQLQLFKGSDSLISPLFPELNLTPKQIFQQ
ncbi:Uma2 family endonuclease [Crocosphaera sp. XPORK-15E]|uniref:Uma2 family endonuclease n=1 Tax=Crocosphaera sp. XPORK-15E TaxID=3110247 RepID=UPI002B1EA55A|nr:Uma2 family endonuclease [Crocosphaera sp. XPORK-15E]MEA5536066.1 Uma2 family endonuclease [Crocosphaera sp. XPORK-15E]